MMRQWFVLLALALVVCVSPRAQPVDAADLMRALRESTARLDYEAAEQRAREVLARFEAFSPSQLVEAHATLGIVLHARNEAVEARQQFDAALSIDPTLRLDSVLVSPKTLEVFEEARQARAVAPSSPSPPTLRYVILTDPRPGAALRSAVLPGWGQFHKGDRGKGVAFAIGAGALAVGTVGAHVARAQARDRYREATAPAEIETHYVRYNQLNRLRSVLAIGTAVVWSASVIDGLVTGRPTAPAAETSSISWSPTVEAPGLALRIRL